MVTELAAAKWLLALRCWIEAPAEYLIRRVCPSDLRSGNRPGDDSLQPKPGFMRLEDAERFRSRNLHEISIVLADEDLLIRRNMELNGQDGLHASALQLA